MAQRVRGVALSVGLAAAAVVLACGWAHGQQQATGDGVVRPAEPLEARTTYDGCQVVRVLPRSMREELTALAVAETTWFCERRGPELDLVVSAEGRAALDEAGIAYTVRIADLRALIDAERAQYEAVRAAEANGAVLRGDTYFDTFRTHAEVLARVDLLVANNPSIALPVNVGTSRFGRDIRGLTISAPDSPENPRNQRRQVLFNGTQHAREWLSPTTVMFIAHQLIADFAAGDPRVTELLSNAEIIIVPIINPDGYDFTWSTTRLWRKTRVDNGNGTFGVDPNRNWGYEWGGEGASTSPGNDTYRGPNAFSEPETAALRDFMIARPRIDAHIDFHTFSQLILSPWGYTSNLPPQPIQSVFDRLNADMAREIFGVHGMTYIGGPSYTTIYPASGTVPDWVLGDRGKLSWTIELRDTGAYGFVAPASEIIPTGEENYAGVLTLIDYVALPLRFTFPDGLPEVAESGAATSFRVVVDSMHNQVQPGTAQILFRIGSEGAFTGTDLMPLPTEGEYLATLPAGACGDVFEYRFAAQTAGGASAAYPVGDSTAALSVPVVQTVYSYRDSCEVIGGWVVGAPGDAATTGVWEQAVPQATAAQPGEDVSDDGTRCWITGAQGGSGVGSFDVDGGATTLTSGAFSAVDPEGGVSESVTLSYWLWYSNDRGSSPAQDPFYVFISNDDGANWQPLQTIPANGSTNSWVRYEFELLGLLEPSEQMRLRFVADDEGAGSIIEAAVDEVRVEVRGCPVPPSCAADFDGNGAAEVPDIFAFLSAWFASDAAADIDGTPGVGVPDIFAFLSIWFAGCP
jgi:hypothetical protein